MYLIYSWGNSELILESTLFSLLFWYDQYIPTWNLLPFSHEQFMQIIKLELVWAVNILSFKKQITLSLREAKE